MHAEDGRRDAKRTRVHQCALSLSGPPYNGQFPARRDAQVDMRENQRAWLVRKRHVPKLDRALELWRPPCTPAVSDIALMPQNLHDSLGAHTGLGEGVRRTRNGVHGSVEVICVSKENNHVPGCELTGENALGPVPHHHGQPYGPQEIHHRSDPRLIPHALEERLKAVFALRLEAFVDLILLRQPLYDANGGQCFLRQGSQQSRADASFARDRKSTRLNSSHLVISYAV